MVRQQEIDNEYHNKRLTRKEKRELRNKPNPSQKITFELAKITPLTKNQQSVFTFYEQNKNLFLTGCAGTGKTFLLLYLALNELLNNNKEKYNKIIIVRSVVPTRNIGFLPGKDVDKIKVYEKTYTDICTKLFNRGDAYKYLKDKKILEFTTTSFIRGNTEENCIIIVDEIANMTFHELDSIITRVGENSKIMFSGDFKQSDFTADKDKNGLFDFTNVLKTIDCFKFVDFQIEDIVRSGLVKQYITARETYRDKK